MRIGFLVAGFPPDRIGGAELQAQQLAERLIAYDHRVTVFTRKLAANRNINEVINGVCIKRRRLLPIAGIRLIWDTFVAVLQVVRMRQRLDVLLCYQTVNSGLIGVVSAFFTGIPVVVSIRGSEEYRVASSPLKRMVTKFAYRRASTVAVQTALIEKELLEIFARCFDDEYITMLRRKLRVVPNGINLPAANEVQGTDVLYVGRLIKNKGVDDLLVAMRDHKHLKAVIVGDGPDRSRLEAIASGQNVEFVGLVDFELVPTYLRNARMLVLPSRLGDGLPNVILEAMAHGVPVISTRSAGIPDVIKDGETGFLFEPGDTQKLSSLIQQLVSNDELHAAVRDNAQDYIGQYAWDVVVPMVVSMLEVAGTPR